MSQLILGVDPGAKGALALFAPVDGIMIWVKDMPNVTKTLTTGKKTTVVDIPSLISIIEQTLLYAAKIEYTLVMRVERVNAFSKQSAPAAFNFGYAAAIPTAIAMTMGIEVKFVHPAVWKRAAGLQASDKDEARLLAKNVFPGFDEALRLKQHVDRADAMLIAAYIGD